MGATILLSLVPNLIQTSLKMYLDVLRLRLEAEGRTEITLEDLNSLFLEDPEEVIRKYRESKGLS